MKVRDTNHVADFHDLCMRQSPQTLSLTLSPILSLTFPVHCNGLNSITATQTGLSQTCHGLCRKHLDMSRRFVFTTFVICVRDFPCGEVSVKVGIMEFGLNGDCTLEIKCLEMYFKTSLRTEARALLGSSLYVVSFSICVRSTVIFDALVAMETAFIVRSALLLWNFCFKMQMNSSGLLLSLHGTFLQLYLLLRDIIIHGGHKKIELSMTYVGQLSLPSLRGR